MANTYATLGSLFTGIADAIRTKTGGTDAIVADDFPDIIASLTIDPSKISMVTRSGNLTLNDILKINLTTLDSDDSVESIVYDNNNIIWQNPGTTIGEMSIGDSIYLTVNGVDVEFIIVYQGNPSSSEYGSNADGTWIHAKDIYTNSAWETSSSIIYAGSTIDTYCNTTFYNLIADNEKQYIKEINVPYGTSTGSDNDGTSGSAAKGYIQRKIFIPSNVEIWNLTNYMYPTLGVYLGYYTADNTTAWKYYNGQLSEWWTRNILAYLPAAGFRRAYYVGTGTMRGSSSDHTLSKGVAPMMVLNKNTVINALGKIVA